MYEFDYLSLTQLGANFNGVSGRKVGGWLVEIGLRDEKRDPTRLAWDKGYCRNHVDDEGKSFVVWNRIKTTQRLIEAGFKPAGILDKNQSSSPVIQPPTGPFVIGAKRDLGYPLIDSKGTEHAVFIDERLGHRTAWLMTQADQHRKL